MNQQEDYNSIEYLCVPIDHTGPVATPRAIPPATAPAILADSIAAPKHDSNAIIVTGAAGPVKPSIKK
jgi:hypothetical protein